MQTDQGYGRGYPFILNVTEKGGYIFDRERTQGAGGVFQAEFEKR